MRYEFSGLYMFGLPLPAFDDEVANTPANRAARERDLADMLDASTAPPRAEAMAAPAFD